MSDLIGYIKGFFRKIDMVLLILCLSTSAFSTVIMASVTNAPKFGDSARYVIIHIVAAVLGVGAFLVVSSIDAEFFHEHRSWFFWSNVVLLVLLLTPFGTDNGTGNRSWLDFPFLPVNIQPAEICKIFYILIMASVMASHQNQLSSIRSVFHMVIHLFVIFAMNLLISRDAGVSLIFFAIFLGMVFAGGVKWYWFAIGIGAVSVVGPIYWEHLMSTEQKNRILYVFMPDVIDPTGTDEGWHTIQSLNSLTGGGLTGQGLFSGNRTQAGSLYAQHTDYIFSSIGEEMGFIGCILVLVLLFAIVARCIWVGRQSHDYMRRMVCFGAASALIFQIICNVGMCIGVMPVIGLTLPLISYGGSSIVSIYAMLGLVSGVYARPEPRSHERYILPPR